MGNESLKRFPHWKTLSAQAENRLLLHNEDRDTKKPEGRRYIALWRLKGRRHSYFFKWRRLRAIRQRDRS